MFYGVQRWREHLQNTAFMAANRGFLCPSQAGGFFTTQALIGAHWSPQLLIEIPQRIGITSCAEALGTQIIRKLQRLLSNLF